MGRARVPAEVPRGRRDIGFPSTETPAQLALSMAIAVVPVRLRRPPTASSAGLGRGTSRGTRSGGPTLFHREVSSPPCFGERLPGWNGWPGGRMRGRRQSSGRWRIRRPWTAMVALLTAAHHGFELTSGVGLVWQPEFGSRDIRCALGCADSPLGHPGREGGPTVGPGAGSVVGDRSRRCVRALPPLALATQQAGHPRPHRGGRTCTNGAPCLQRAPAPVGPGLRALDCPRGATRRPSVVAPGAGGVATPSSLGPTPFFMVDGGSREESRLVESRRSPWPGWAGYIRAWGTGHSLIRQTSRTPYMKERFGISEIPFVNAASFIGGLPAERGHHGARRARLGHEHSGRCRAEPSSIVVELHPAGHIPADNDATARTGRWRASPV